MKAAIFVLSTVSSFALAQTAPKPPPTLCVDDQCVQAPVEVPSLNTWYADGFEAMSLNTTLWSLSNAGSASHSFPTGISREGTRAHRCDLVWNSNGSYRCEVSGLMLSYRGLNRPEFFKDTWWGFSIRPGDDPIQKGCIYAQWHGYARFGPGDESDTVTLPVLALAIDTTDPNANRWTLHAQSAHSQPTLEADRRTIASKYVLAPVGDPNVWTDWVFRIRWDYRIGGDGVLQVWRNGRLVFDKQGVAIGHNDNQLPYFKMGLYCANYKSGTPTGARRTAYHDAFRMMGANGSYEGVRPR
jgi:hypothetical protein